MEFSKEKIDIIQTLLKGVDGEDMQTIIEKVGMREQMLRQLIMTSPLNQVYDLFKERLDLEINATKPFHIGEVRGKFAEKQIHIEAKPLVVESISFTNKSLGLVPEFVTKKDNKHTRMKAFHAELQKFIDTLSFIVLDTKTLKRKIDMLPQTHPVHVTYRAYLEKAGDKRRNYSLTDYDRLAKHMKYMKGYESVFSHFMKCCGYGNYKVYKNIITKSLY